MSRASLAALFLILTGCPWVGDAAYTEQVRDADGDGGIGDRFGGPDCLDQSGSIANCDADGDGFLAAAVGGDDCDDSSGAVYPGAPERCDLVDNDCDGAIDNDDDDATSDAPLYADADGDGDGDGDRAFVCQEYLDPANPNSGIHVGNSRDCDDSDPSVRAGADELCDGIDNNCDGTIDDVGIWFADADGDGWGDTTSQTSGPCILPPGSTLASDEGDCDDSDPAISPGATEVPYDDVDDNCNGNLDNWDLDFDGRVPAEHWAAAQSENSQQPPGEQWEIFPGDCDDTNPARFVGNPEVCDGVDNDCDEAIDTADLAGATELDELTLRAQVLDVYEDRDGDGFFGTEVTLCPAQVDPVIHSTVQDDCYDSGSSSGFGVLLPETIHPAAMEQCDGVDNNCDGRADWDFMSFAGSGAYFLDLDEDLFGDLAIEACGPVAGIAVDGGDCNEADPETWPGSTEICGDTVRQDCSSSSIWDCDGDGQEGDYFGNGTGEDCDDDDDAVFQTSAPGGEICDGIDNDCDGLIDSADLDNLDAGILPFWYPDLDGDGWGTTIPSPGQACDSPGANFAPQDGDCNDSDDDISPDAVENCDGFDTNCDLLIPNDVVAGEVDDDGDGFSECQGDLDDTNASIFPGGGGSLTWYPDLDGDGYGNELLGVLGPSAPTLNHILTGGDCDDTRILVHPGIGHELCDGIDNNCDGASITDGSTTSIDVSNPLLGTPLQGSGGVPYATDIDQDGDFSLAVVVFSCDDMGATPVLTAPEQGPDSIDLRDLIGNSLALSYLDCDGPPDGTLYAVDADDDGVPDPPGGLASLFVDCSGAYPGPFLPYDEATHDCAPSDPSRSVEVGPGEFGDTDGDGNIASVSTPGDCVDQTFTMPGEDCNDNDFDLDAGTSNQELLISSGTAFNIALETCTDAELWLDMPNAPMLDPIVFNPLVNLQLDARLVLRGSIAGCTNAATADCLGGNITLPLQIDLSFEGLGISAQITSPTGQGDTAISLQESRLVDTGSFLLTGGQLTVSNTQVFTGMTPSFSLTSVDAEFDSSDLSGTAGASTAAGIEVDAGSELSVWATTFDDLLPAIQTRGAVELEGVAFTGGTGIEARDSATVFGEDVQFSTTDSPMFLGENSMVQCRGCLIDDPTTSIVIDPNGDLAGPTVHFEDGTISVSVGSVPLFQGQLGPSSVTLEGMIVDTQRTLIATPGHAEILDSTVTSIDLTSPLFEVLDAMGRLELQNVDIAEHLGIVILAMDGEVTASDLWVEARTLLNSTGNTYLEDITAVQNTRVAPFIVVSRGFTEIDGLLFDGVDGLNVEPLLSIGVDAEVVLRGVDAQIPGGIEIGPTANVHIQDSTFMDIRAAATPILITGGSELVMDDTRVTMNGDGFTSALHVDDPLSSLRMNSSLLWAGATAFSSSAIENRGTIDLVSTTVVLGPATVAPIHNATMAAQLSAQSSLFSIPILLPLSCMFSFTGSPPPENVFINDSWVEEQSHLDVGCLTAVPFLDLGSVSTTGGPSFLDMEPQNPVIRTVYGELAN